MCLEISLKPYYSYKQAVKTADESDLYSNPCFLQKSTDCFPINQVIRREMSRWTISHSYFKNSCVKCQFAKLPFAGFNITQCLATVKFLCRKGECWNTFDHILSAILFFPSHVWLTRRHLHSACSRLYVTVQSECDWINRDIGPV